MPNGARKQLRSFLEKFIQQEISHSAHSDIDSMIFTVKKVLLFAQIVKIPPFILRIGSVYLIYKET